MKNTKFLSIVLSLVMVLGTISALQIPVLASTTDALTIDDIAGTVVYEQNFDNKAAGISYTDIGDGYIGTDRKNGATYTVYYETVGFPTAANANNVAFGMRSGGKLSMHVTEEEKADIDAAGKTLKISNATIANVKQYSFKQADGSYKHYLIGYRTNDPARRKWYFNCDADGNVTDRPSGTASDGVTPLYDIGNSYSFFNTETGEPMTPTANSTVDFPTPETVKKVDGWIVGSFAASMNFAFPNNGNLYSAEALCYNIDAIEMRFAKTGCSLAAAVSMIDGNGATVSVSGAAVVGNSKDAPSYFAAADLNTNTKTYTAPVDEVWHNILTDMDFDKGTFKVYYDGYPLYFPVKSGSTVVGYTSEFAIPGHAQFASFPKIGLTAQRYQCYFGHLPAVDDIVMKYDTDTVETKVNWTAISKGQSANAVTQDLDLFKTVTVKGQEYDVVWSSDNTAVITNEGTVIRGESNTVVNLTATVAGKTITITATVLGRSGKPTIHIAGASHEQSYDPVTWYPQQGWGYYFDEYFTGAEINNAAQGGHSAKSFYHLFFDQRIKSKWQAGDYILICFGGNDYFKLNTSQNGNYVTIDGERVLIGSSLSEYEEYIMKYVAEARAAGVTPIFVTVSTCGSTYDHDGNDQFTAYQNKTKEIAAAVGAPCIDRNQHYIDYIEQVKAAPATPEADKAPGVIPESVLEEIRLYNLVDRGVLTAEQVEVHPGNLNANGTDLFHYTDRGAKIEARWVAKDIYSSNNADLKALATLMDEEYIKPTMWLIGDSSVTDWSAWGDNWYPQTGWGQLIGDYFTGIKVQNKAISGESARSFYYQASRFNPFKDQMLPGDYLFISFGPNDEAYSAPGSKTFVGYDGKTYTWGSTGVDFENDLRLFTDYAQQRGIQPVFVTCYTHQRVYDSVWKAMESIRKVAEEDDIPLIDSRKISLAYAQTFQEEELQRGGALPEDYTNELFMVADTLKKDFGFTDEQVAAHGNSYVNGANAYADTAHLNINGAKKMANWIVFALSNSTDEKLVELKTFLKDGLVLEEDVTSSNIKITGVEFDAVPDSKGRTGAAIRATLPEGRLSKMKWVFAADDGHRYYSSTIVPETAGVKVSGDVKFGVIFNNGNVDANGNLNGDKKINAVDAIFMIDGMEFFTNLLDKAAKN